MTRKCISFMNYSRRKKVPFFFLSVTSLLKYFFFPFRCTIPKRGLKDTLKYFTIGQNCQNVKNVIMLVRVQEL